MGGVGMSTQSHPQPLGKCVLLFCLTFQEVISQTPSNPSKGSGPSYQLLGHSHTYKSTGAYHAVPGGHTTLQARWSLEGLLDPEKEMFVFEEIP